MIESAPTIWSRIRDGARRCASLLIATTGKRDAAISGASLNFTIAIPFEHRPGWAAQHSFMKSVTQSLALAAQPGQRILILHIQDGADEAPPAGLDATVVPVEKSVWFRASARDELLGSLGADCVLHLFGVAQPVQNAGMVGWIADFQHFRLPKFFDETEIADRDHVFRQLLKTADIIMLSSRDSERDCLRFDASASGRTRVHSFPSTFAFSGSLPAPSSGSRLKYHLPEKFALAANQFWAHKNHAVLIEAARQLKQRGVELPIVLTGLPADYRDPLNQCISNVLQQIAVAELWGTVIPLALVSRADLLALTREAAVIIQPSRFEGWSTVVQDSKALARPLVCSDLAVHREQAPNALGFFDPDKPEELVAILAAQWPSQRGGVNESAEGIALAQEREFARTYGSGIWQTCREAALIAARRRQNLSVASATN